MKNVYNIILLELKFLKNLNFLKKKRENVFLLLCNNRIKQKSLSIEIKRNQNEMKYHRVTTRL